MQLGYALLREMRGKGYATELTKKGINIFLQKRIIPLCMHKRR